METCSIPDCEAPVKSRGICNTHYQRWLRTGQWGGPIVRRHKGRTCSVEGCDRKHGGRGFCDGHLLRFLRYGDPGSAEFEPRNPGATCSIADCDRPLEARGWCNAHYLRWRATGDPVAPFLEHNPKWTGDAATYNAVHLRIRAERGSAKLQTCEDCGGPADHWTFDHSDPSPKYDEKGRPYSTDLSCYRPLCKTCHRRFDAERTRASGCSVPGCDQPHKARGLCGRHYQRALAAGE